jgi:transcriptional regulator GlxA family with amidase domain
MVFDGVDELDFVGPLDVFSYAALLSDETEQKGRVITIGSRLTPLRGGNGLRFLADHDFADAPRCDVLIIPGGSGTDQLIKDGATLNWIKSAASSVTWLCSVCSGAFLLQAAGLAEGRRITTHSMGIDILRAANTGEPVEGERYVVDGNLVTSQGVSAGIDMSLWLVGQLYGIAHAKTVRAYLDYNPEPPF